MRLTMGPNAESQKFFFVFETGVIVFPLKSCSFLVEMYAERKIFQEGFLDFSFFKKRHLEVHA